MAKIDVKGASEVSTETVLDRVTKDLHGGIRALRHEFRTILGQILGYSELLQDQLSEQNAVGPLEDVNKIKTAAQSMLALVNAAIDIESQQKPSPPEGTDAEGNIRAGRGSLLVVDDNEMNRDMLARRLERKDFLVSVASSGSEALELIKTKAFDLVLLDLMMPGVSGLDVLKTVRRTHRPTELPIIMTTAKDAPEDVVQAFDLGANDYLTKPLDFSVVLARCETQLKLKRMMAETEKLAGQLEMRNAFIRKAFGRYLTDDVVSDLLARPEGLSLGGEKRTVTILLSDIRGFSSLVERLSPENVIALLNVYLGRMTEIIARHSGTIDEFIGDSILAVFGAPLKRDDDADRALSCAVEMQTAMDEINAELRAKGLPDVSMGIGIHTGEAIVGNVGSAKRAKYAVVGPTVVLASRIESYSFGGQILISAETKDALKQRAFIQNTFRVHPKGTARPVVLHDIAGIEGRPPLLGAAGQAALRALPRPLAFRYVLIEEKHCLEEAREGSLIEIGKNSALVSIDPPLEEMTDIKMTLLDEAQVPRAGHIYAKVLHRDLDRKLLRVRFKSLDAELHPYLESLTSG